MTLTELKNKKVYWVIVILLLLVIFLIIFLLFKPQVEPLPTPVEPPTTAIDQPYKPGPPQKVSSLPKQPSPLADQTITPSSLSKLQINLPQDMPTPPKTFQVTQYASQKLDIVDYARRFGFEKKINDTLYKHQWNNSHISFDPYSEMFSYFYEENKHSHPEDLPAFNLDKVKEIALQFVKDKLSLNTATLSINEITYLTSEGAHYEEVNLEESEVVQIGFVYLSGETEAYPTFQNKKSAASIIIDKSYMVVQAEFVSNNLIPSKELAIESLSIIEALSQNNLGYFDYMYSDNGVKLEPSMLRTINVETVSLEYHIDQNRGITYPMYVLMGTGITTDNQQTPVEFKTPAVPLL